MATLTSAKNMTQCTPEDQRLIQLHTWLAAVLEAPMQRLEPVTGDCSFRRYFRVYSNDTRYIVMDAPPDKENCDAFIAIAKSFYQLGLTVPVIYAEDLDQGFLLLTDFGDALYLDRLNARTANKLYTRAIDDLLRIQSCQQIENYVLPEYDRELYQKEIALFRDWYLAVHLGVELSSEETSVLAHISELLIEEALSQPQVCTHRDYHSRNLMFIADGASPGILDFQDAVWGPITYDLLSLLKDCYIDWPEKKVEAWVLSFQKKAVKTGILAVDDPKQFLRWFDWIGLQRHLKCLGIFARVHHRDHKSSYLQYLPRTLAYAKRVCDRYKELMPLKPLLEKGRVGV